jgi:hypothetical protein
MTAKEQFDANKLKNRSAYNEKRARNDKLRKENNAALPPGHGRKSQSLRAMKRAWGVTKTARAGRRKRNKLNAAIPRANQPWATKVEDKE